MPAVSQLPANRHPTASATTGRRDEVRALFDLPFPELLHRAGSVHRAHFDPAEVQVSTLLSIKTGGCPEDCGYCPQAARYHTGVEAHEADVDRGGGGEGQAGQGRRRLALLHGRGLAFAEGPRHPQGRRDDPAR